MKKKYRDITVGGELYAWAMSPGAIKIWKDKKVIFQKDIDDDITIYPRFIAKLICAIRPDRKISCSECGSIVDDKRVEFVIHNDVQKTDLILCGGCVCIN